MIPTRHIISTGLTAKIVAYLDSRDKSESQTAKLLGVPESFVMHLRRKEFSLTLQHVERLVNRLDMPLGEFLIAVSETGERKSRSKLHDAFVRSMRLGDRADAAMLRAMAKPRKKAS